MLITYLRKSFCTRSLSIQLKQYQPFLDKHNRALKIPHPRLASQEERIVTALLQQGKQWDVIAFLMRNRKQQIAWQGTIDSLKQALSLSQSSSSISSQQTIYGALALAAHGQTSIAQQYIQNNINKKQVNKLDADEILLYLYTKLLTDKTLPKQGSALIQRQYNGPMEEEWQKIREYITLKEKGGWKIGKGKEGGRRSILERQIQCFIKVLGYQRKREVTLNNYKVDFIVKSSQSQKQYILQVNGNHHYTLAGKLLPLQMLRALGLSLYLPVRFVHHTDFNKTVGYRNKLDYLEFLLEQCKDINWQPTGPHNSNWVLDSEEFK